MRLLSRVVLLCLVLFALTGPAEGFVRGDVDEGGTVDVADAVSLLTALFQPGSDPIPCADAADVNDDGALDVSDAVYLLSALFVPGSPSIPAPYPSDGVDPTTDSLPPCEFQGLLPFETIAQNDVSGVGAETYEIIDSTAEWSAFWTQHSPEPLPFVDFTEDMVVVVLQFFTFGGASLNIDEIEVIGSTIEIRYTEFIPGVFIPAPAQPHHFVRTTRVPGSANFVVTQIFAP